jgi:SAM-dependent methyltransferase
MYKQIWNDEPGGFLTFKGDFDALYREEADPWGQTADDSQELTEFYRQNRHERAKDVLAWCGPSGFQALEVGCGLGHSTAELAAYSFPGKWAGCDISMEAITRARGTYPGASFFPVDIANPEWPFLGSERGRYHAVLLSHLFWYTIPGFAHVLRNCAGLLRPGGMLLVTQGMFRGEPRYMPDIIARPFDILRLCADRAPADLQFVSATINPDSPALIDVNVYMRKVAP